MTSLVLTKHCLNVHQVQYVPGRISADEAVERASLPAKERRTIEDRERYHVYFEVLGLVNRLRKGDQSARKALVRLNGDSLAQDASTRIAKEQARRASRGKPKPKPKFKTQYVSDGVTYQGGSPGLKQQG